MIITPKKVTVREISCGYADLEERGVYGYDNKLNIRPEYQREFVYKDKQRDAVINTVMRKLPLNVMYWEKLEDDDFAVMDGQQRTISICQYVTGDFSINERYFHNLDATEQHQILDYELMVFVCDGPKPEILEWFRIINTGGEPLVEQELRNTVYTGSWLSDAKKKFSRNGCPAFSLASDYLRGTPIRQDYLETALDWISDGHIEDYMAEHHHDPKALELWQYFKGVIDWVKATFPKYRKEMKGLAWGKLYNKYKDNKYDPKELEKEISQLMMDEDVTKKSGVYEYLLSGKENTKYLSIRKFTDSQKRTVYERQEGKCAICGEGFPIEKMDGDHIKEWSLGGTTTTDNLQMVCHKCHKELTKTLFK